MKLTRIGKLRHYAGQKSLDEWVRTEMKQNLEAIEDTLTRPRVYCEYNGSTGKAVPASTSVFAIFPNKIKDDANLARIVNDAWEFIAPRDDVYLISASLQSVAVNAGIGHIAGLYRNRVYYRALSIARNNRASADDVALMGSGSIFLNKNDRLSIDMVVGNATTFSTDVRYNWVTICN